MEYILTKLTQRFRSICGTNLGKFALFALSAQLLPAATHAENNASQLELINCGGYTISSIVVQYKRGIKRDPGWKDAYVVTRDVKSGTAICIDVTEHGGDNVYEEYRLRVNIGAGERVKCDGTNYDVEGGRRVMVMKGSTYNNNGCRTIDYREATSECDTYGERRTVKCSNL